MVSYHAPAHQCQMEDDSMSYLSGGGLNVTDADSTDNCSRNMALPRKSCSNLDADIAYYQQTTSSLFSNNAVSTR
jgi:hypothetical protein